jgi:hypothetical protein
MTLDNSGNLLVGTTSAAGSMSNTAQVSGGGFHSYNGSGTIPNATATTIATVASPGLYIVHAYIPGYSAGTGNWSNYCIVSCTGSSNMSILVQPSPAGIVFSTSGLNIQITQGGGTIGYNWSVIRIA